VNKHLQEPRNRAFGDNIPDSWYGRTVDQLRICFIARDGGTRAAQSYGVDRRLYYPRVQILEEADVWQMIHDRAAVMKAAIETETMPAPCTPVQAWDGRKCDGYCPVAKYCVEKGDNPYVSSF
jgi:hypothetical protein